MPAVLLLSVTAFLAGGASITRPARTTVAPVYATFAPAHAFATTADSSRPTVVVPTAMVAPTQPPQQENKPARPHTPPPDAELLQPAQPHFDQPPPTSNGSGGYGTGGTDGDSPTPSDGTSTPGTPGSGNNSDEPREDSNPDRDPEEPGSNRMAAFFVLAISFRTANSIR
ncbi:hypothetical protein ACFYV7_12910 [Nocardia suismassiliense]|uniref:Uncharacterized protein n=1 Tax=Nocardia suismassiliense TaxID=2077092 RepID=A0ABW6QST7_9NOCA